LRLWERKQEDLPVTADDGRGVVQVGDDSALGEQESVGEELLREGDRD